MYQWKVLSDDLEILANIGNGDEFKIFLQWWTTGMVTSKLPTKFALQWRHNERNGVSNHRRLYCLFNRIFKRRSSKKTSMLRVTGVRSPVDSRHKGTVARIMFPFDDVIMENLSLTVLHPSFGRLFIVWARLCYFYFSPFVHDSISKFIYAIYVPTIIILECLPCFDRSYSCI